MIFIVKAGELELIKMVTMHILTYTTVIDYIDNLPLLFVINLFNILNDDICLHTSKHYL